MSLKRTLLLPLLMAFGCTSRSPQPPAAPAPVADPGEVYRSLRDMALDNRVPGASPSVALMELGLGDATATLVSTADGATSIYLSSGGGFIGAGEHEPVRVASAAFLRAAAEHAALMEPSEERPLPEADHVRFYVGSDDGLRTAEAEEAALAGGAHPLSGLYMAGQEVITAVRESSGGR